MSGCPVHTGNCAGMASTGQRVPTEESCTSLEKYSVKTTEITQQIKHRRWKLTGHVLKKSVPQKEDVGEVGRRRHGEER